MGKRPTDGTVRPPPISELLSDGGKTNFNDELQRNKFEQKHGIRLRRVKGGNGGVLHEVVLKPKSDFASLRDFTKWAIKTHRQLLEIKDKGGFTPLHVAISRRHHAFVELVLEHADRIKELLSEQTHLCMTCLHSAIQYRSPLTEFIIGKAKEASGATVEHSGAHIKNRNELAGPTAYSTGLFTIKSTDKDGGWEGMTPLHMAVTASDPDGEHDEDSYGEDSDDDDDGGDAYREEQDEDNESRKATNSVSDHRSTDYVFDKTQASQGGPFRHLRDGDAAWQPNMGIQRRASTFKTSQQSAEPPDAPVGKADSPARRLPFNIVNIVRKLVDANDRVLVECKDARGRTPFQARVSMFLESLAKARGGEDRSRLAERENDRRRIVADDEILRYMRKYIINKFNRHDAMKALYEVGDELILEFDLSGLPRQKIDAEFLHRLSEVLRFEGLLKYVALPRLAFDDENGRSFSEVTNGDGLNLDYATMKAKGQGLRHMCAIFDWLKICQVKEVLEVTVIDHVEPSHSDEAIEYCVDGLGVQIWNWYKVDLSTKVITEKAPEVRDVTLYSSGNNAVLQGWASPEGLAQLKQLQRVHVYVQKGLDSSTRVTENMRKFVETLHLRRTSLKLGAITVTWDFHTPDPNHNSVVTERSIPRAVESDWMETVEAFAKFLKLARPDVSVDPVKIAVIDDGIEASLEEFNGKIHVGESFCRLGELSGRRGAYYVPLGPHGTLMAQIISRVCPAVKLYVAQLEVLPGERGQRSFTTESATEAVKWAVAQRVDIISMSWSISDGRSSITKLEEAIKAADNANIIMFCASVGEGAATDNAYPGKYHRCIKIGASTGNGDRLSWVSDSNSDFLLPGQVPRLATAINTGVDPSNWSNHEHIGSFGSSVSTALAAGLAGVLLYCDRLVSANSVSSRQNRGVDQASEGGEFFRDPTNIRYTFSYLSSHQDRKKFPMVWKHFPENQGTLVWNSKAEPKKTEETKERLEDFMKKLKTRR